MSPYGLAPCKVIEAIWSASCHLRHESNGTRTSTQRLILLHTPCVREEVWKSLTMIIWLMWRRPSKIHSLQYVYASIEGRESYSLILALVALVIAYLWESYRLMLALVLVIAYLMVINGGKWQISFKFLGFSYMLTRHDISITLLDCALQHCIKLPISISLKII